MSSGKIENIEIISRLESIRKFYGLTQTDFAKRLFITQGFYSDMTNRGSGISAKAIVGVAINFPEVNLRWFLTGEGEMLDQLYAVEYKQIQNVEEYDMAVYQQETKKILKMINDLDEDTRYDMVFMIKSFIEILAKNKK